MGTTASVHPRGVSQLCSAAIRNGGICSGWGCALLVTKTGRQSQCAMRDGERVDANEAVSHTVALPPCAMGRELVQMQLSHTLWHSRTRIKCRGSGSVGGTSTHDGHVTWPPDRQLNTQTGASAHRRAQSVAQAGSTTHMQKRIAPTEIAPTSSYQFRPPARMLLRSEVACTT